MLSPFLFVFKLKAYHWYTIIGFALIALYKKIVCDIIMIPHKFTNELNRIWLFLLWFVFVVLWTISIFVVSLKYHHERRGALCPNQIWHALNERKYLYTFLENGDVPIDNNRAENAIRPFAVGRRYVLKNITDATGYSATQPTEQKRVRRCIR